MAGEFSFESPMQFQEGAADSGWDNLKGFWTLRSSAGLGRLDRRELEQMGVPGHLSSSPHGISMQTFQHGEFEVAGLHSCWLRAPKVHVS